MRTSFLKQNLDTILNTDCMTVLPRLGNDSVELTLTDIPYAVTNARTQHSKSIRKFRKSTADELTFKLKPFLTQIVRVTRGSIYIFCSTEQVSQIREFLVVKGLTTRLGIWEKTNPSPVNGQFFWLSGVECCVFARKTKSVFHGHCKNPVWRFPNGRSKKHPTEKPLALFKYLIEMSSNPGDTVLDPCIGSGTTARAAKLTGRHFFGTELDASYYADAVASLVDNPQPPTIVGATAETTQPA